MKYFRTFYALLLLTILIGSSKAATAQSIDVPLVKCDATTTSTMLVTTNPGVSFIKPGVQYQFKGETYEGQTDLFFVEVFFRGSKKDDFWVCDNVRTTTRSYCTGENDGFIAGGLGSNGPTGGNRYGFKYTVPKSWYCSGISKSNLTSELKFQVKWYRAANSSPNHTECFTYNIANTEVLSAANNVCGLVTAPAGGYEFEVCDGWAQYIPLPTQNKALAESLRDQGLYVEWYKEDKTTTLSWGPNGVDEEHYWDYGWDYRNYFDQANNPQFHANGELVRYIRYFVAPGYCGQRIYCGGFIKVTFKPRGLVVETPPEPHTEMFCATDGVYRKNANNQTTKHYRVVLPQLTNGFTYYWYNTPQASTTTVPTPIETGRVFYVEANSTGIAQLWVSKYKKEAAWEGGCEYFSPTSPVVVQFPPEYDIPFEDYKMWDGSDDNPNCDETTLATPPYIYTHQLLTQIDKPTLDQIIILPYLPCVDNNTVFDIKWRDVVDGQDKGFVNFDQEGIPLVQPTQGFSYRKFCYSNVKGNYEDQRMIDGEWYYTRRLKAYLAYETTPGCPKTVRYCALPFLEKRFTLYGDMCEDEDLTTGFLEQITDPSSSVPTPDLTICNNLDILTMVNVSDADIVDLSMQIACKDGTTDLEYIQSQTVDPLLYDINNPTYSWSPDPGGYLTPIDQPQVTIDHATMPVNEGEFLLYVATATYPSTILTQADLEDNYCMVVYKCEKECRSNLDGVTKPYVPVINHTFSTALQRNNSHEDAANELLFDDNNLSTTGINDNNAKLDFKVFPNPVENVLNIEFKKDFNGSLMISDVSGKTVLKNDINNKAIVKMDLSNINPGVYTIHGVDNNNGASIQFNIIKK